MELCIDTNPQQIENARKQCPQGYHIEFSRSGYVLYVLDGYRYDVQNDLCYKDDDKCERIK